MIFDSKNHLMFPIKLDSSSREISGADQKHKKGMWKQTSSDPERSKKKPRRKQAEFGTWGHQKARDGFHEQAKVRL